MKDVPEDVSPVCSRHPERKGPWVCVTCHRYFCYDCVVHKNLGSVIVHVCPCEECRGRCIEGTYDERKDVIVEHSSGENNKSHMTFSFSLKRIKNRFALSMIIPTVTFLISQGMSIMGGGQAVTWLIPVWAALIFLMSGRMFWPYVIIFCCSVFGFIFSIFRLVGKDVLSGFRTFDYITTGLSLEFDIMMLGMWLASIIILGISYYEFTE